MILELNQLPSDLQREVKLLCIINKCQFDTCVQDKDGNYNIIIKGITIDNTVKEFFNNMNISHLYNGNRYWHDYVHHKTYIIAR